MCVCDLSQSQTCGRSLNCLHNAKLSIDSAAVDTTAQTILNFVLAMVLHPEIQKRGKDEIDSIIGPDRLPTINEYGALY